MFSPLELVTRIGDKAGSIGALVSAMGCAMCFPAIASLGAAIGMGFLSQWEGVFINTLLPLFAVLALAMNILGWFSHRQWHRSFIGSIGPILVLPLFIPLVPVRVEFIRYLYGARTNGCCINLGHGFSCE